MSLDWKLPRRTLRCGDRTLVMGVLNVTPDSFSDGGRFSSPAAALDCAAAMAAAGADIIDIGGESTRPGASPVTADEEQRRVMPVIERLVEAGIGVPLSLDTTKAQVARGALAAGVEIINDISGLRFDPALADEAALAGAGLVLMHSRGAPGRLHGHEPAADVFADVFDAWLASIAEAERRGVDRASIALDPGVGFGKSQEQNLSLVANCDWLARQFPAFPLLIGTSRKSFIGRVTGDASSANRLHGTMATVTAAILGGAHIVRVHDVAAAVETARVADALVKQKIRVGS